MTAADTAHPEADTTDPPPVATATRTAAPTASSASAPHASGQRRQWGSDRRTQPLPPVAPPASDRQITLGRLGIVFTLLAWAAYILVTVISQFINRGFQGMRFTSETVIYVVIMSFLTFSSLMYLVARQGSLYRSRAHRRVPRAVIDDAFDSALPTMTVLVPSYREQIATIRKTLLSAALQEYPYLRIVLLLDDPPNPGSSEDAELLEQARALAGEITEWLAEPRTRLADTLDRFERASLVDSDPTVAQMTELAEHYGWAADWLLARAEAEPREDHVDVFFAEQVLRSLGEDFAAVQRALTEAIDAGVLLPRARLVQLHRRLAWTFRAELTWFERKFARVAVARVEQGDESQQLPRADGTQFRAQAIAGRPVRGCGSGPGR